MPTMQAHQQRFSQCHIQASSLLSSRSLLRPPKSPRRRRLPEKLEPSPQRSQQPPQRQGGRGAARQNALLSLKMRHTRATSECTAYRPSFLHFRQRSPASADQSCSDGRRAVPEVSLPATPVMPATPGNNKQAPLLPPSQDPKVLYGAAAFARYAKFLAPAAELQPTAAPKPQAANAKTPTRTKVLASLHIPSAEVPSVPPTPPQKRQRTSLRVAAQQGPSRGGDARAQ